MTLPNSLKTALSVELQGKSLKDLAAASADLSSIYRDKDRVKQGMQNKFHREAYLTVRLPATFEAVTAVLTSIQERFIGQISSLLDLGAGPGTASWAATELFSALDCITLLEKDPQLVELGKRLAHASDYSSLREATWIKSSITALDLVGSHDLVIMSYVVGELSEDEYMQALHAGWKAAKKCLVIIEPGTPRGYQLILKARSFFLESGGHLLAPCPHANTCPMLVTPHWCHFKVRVERSSEHRRTKEAALGYEDEKYSYMAATKEPMPFPSSRIVGHPQVHSGHLSLTLCTADGIKERTYSKKQGELYRLAKKAEWGDAWNLEG